MITYPILFFSAEGVTVLFSEDFEGLSGKFPSSASGCITWNDGPVVIFRDQSLSNTNLDGAINQVLSRYTFHQNSGSQDFEISGSNFVVLERNLFGEASGGANIGMDGILRTGTVEQPNLFKHESGDVNYEQYGNYYYAFPTDDFEFSGDANIDLDGIYRFVSPTFHHNSGDTNMQLGPSVHNYVTIQQILESGDLNLESKGLYDVARQVINETTEMNFINKGLYDASRVIINELSDLNIEQLGSNFNLYTYTPTEEESIDDILANGILRTGTVQVINPIAEESGQCVINLLGEYFIKLPISGVPTLEYWRPVGNMCLFRQSATMTYLEI